MRFFVSGAAGLAGHAITTRLARQGHEVLGLVRRAEDAAALRALGARPIEGDLSDPRELAAMLEGVSHVIHAAGVADERAPLEVHGWVNVAGTENLLRAARHVGVGRFVFLSSTDVTLTGVVRRGLNEDQDPGRPPLGRLGRTKFEAEEMVVGLCGPRFETVVLRPGLLWGPRDRLLLPRVGRLAKEGKLRLIGEGTSMVATTHAENLAEAAHKAALSPAAVGGVYYTLDPQMMLQRDFLGGLAEALGASRPGPGPGLGARRFLGRFGLGPKELDWVEAMRLGLSASFDGTRARRDLDYVGELSVYEGMESLRAWVAAEGGEARVVGHARPVPGPESLVRQREIADERAPEEASDFR